MSTSDYKSVRVPVIPLDYNSRFLAEKKELLFDYNTGQLYVVSAEDKNIIFNITDVVLEKVQEGIDLDNLIINVEGIGDINLSEYIEYLNKYNLTLSDNDSKQYYAPTVKFDNMSIILRDGVATIAGFEHADNDTYAIKHDNQIKWVPRQTFLDLISQKAYEDIRQMLNDYATKTGTGASGTWGINITGNANTATKLHTPRTISLAGGASGSATFDGSGDISINTTINTATKATNDGNGANIANTYLKKAGDTVTGTLNVPTQAITDNSTKVANTAFVQSAVDSKVSQLVNSAPATLDTLNELSSALGNDPNFATTVTNMIGLKEDKTVVNSKLSTHNADTTAHADIRQKFNSYLPLTGGTVTGPIVGNVKGNADTATKLVTPRTISLTGKAVGSTSFNGSDNASINVTTVNADTATNADKLDGYHETDFLRYRGEASATGEDTLWNQIGIKEYDEMLPEGITDSYSYGAVVSLPADSARLDIWYNDYSSVRTGGLWYRTGLNTRKNSWAILLDTANYNKYAPTKTGTGASGTWDINISGTATKATNDGNGANIANTYLKKAGDTVTGTLNVPTQATTDNSTKVANTAFVQSAVDNKVSKLVNSAPEALNTLNELSNALGNDPNFATTVTNMIGLKEDKTVVNTKLSTHNTDTSAHEDIRQMIKDYVTNTGEGASGTWGTGNANTATKLQTPRTISLTGKAVGSTSFDGSNNASINVTSVSADTAKSVGNLNSKSYDSTDNGGRRKYLILYDITNWYNGNSTNNLYGSCGFNGIVTLDRYGGFSPYATTVLLTASVSYRRMGDNFSEAARHLRSSSDTIIPCIIKNGNIYYLALQINISSYNLNFLGTWYGELIWKELLCQSGETIPAGYEMVLLQDDYAADAKVTRATKADNDGNGANIADTYLKKAGDTVTGTLNVPTQAITDNSTKVANTAFVQSAVDSKVSQLVNSAPATLDTLNELSSALGNDPNFATTVTNMIGLKEDKTVVNSKLSTHNADTTAHADIRQKFNSYLPLTGGTVTGPIVGNVKGNADTATKLVTPRTISLTGKAVGSTSFDGSNNASINVTSVSADTAKSVGNLNSKSYDSTDNGGRRKYLILYDITNWYNGNSTNNLYGYCGFNGIVTLDRYGGFSPGATTVLLTASVSYRRMGDNFSEAARHLRSSSDTIIPCIIKNGNIYYLALQINISSYNLNFLGTWYGELIWKELLCQSGETIPAGYEMVLLQDDYAADAKVTRATKADNDGNGANIADTYLKKAGDTVTGTLNVPTQPTTDNSTKVANTAFVQSAVSQLVNSAPTTLDTLNELSNALGNDPNFATTVSNMIGQKADKTAVDNKIALHNTDGTAHQPILDLINTNQAEVNNNLSTHNTDTSSHEDIRLMIGQKADNDTLTSYVPLAGATMTGELTVPALKATNGFIPNTDTTSVNTASGGSALVIKKASSTDAPNNGVVLEYGNSTPWAGQLYMSDNATQGLYWNGWSDGKRGTWKKVYMEGNTNDIKFADGTVLTIE